MPRFPTRILLALAVASSSALPVSAQTDTPFSAADVEAASYGGGDLPSGRSALTTKVQVLLDRSGISPGVIDGFKGLGGRQNFKRVVYVDYPSGDMKMLGFVTGQYLDPQQNKILAAVFRSAMASVTSQGKTTSSRPKWP